MTSTVGRLLVALVGIGKTRFLLRTVGFARTISLMSAPPYVWPTNDVLDPRWSREIAWAGDRCGGSCLDRSVLLWFVMRQHGLDPALRIGVAREGEAIDGHAWVELDGMVVNDHPDKVARFLTFDEDPTELVFR